MAGLFHNKYRIASARLQAWNYASEAMYFITICTKNRKNYFGESVQTIAHNDYRDAMHGVSITIELQPTDIGLIASTEWFKTVELRPDMNLELGEFVVMPNHIHGIVIIGTNEYNTSQRCRDAMHGVSTTTVESNTENKNKFAPQSKNVGSIIRGYKSSVTTFARKNNIVFEWQPLFHDHIIRSANEYHKISNYIINNPAKWKDDKFYEV